MGLNMQAIRCIFALCACTTGWNLAYAQNNDFSSVQITVHHVTGNIYYLEGQGGNIGLSVGDDGVVMIDTQFAPLTEKILAAIETVSDGDIRMIINTHVHGDHTGGNANLGALGLPILAHDNVRVRMSQGVGGEPSPLVARPVLTFSDSVDLHFNGEDVHVFKVPAAHTDGDSFISFPGSNVIHLGDVFRTTGYPFIDTSNGGTAKGTLEALQMVLDMAGPETRILPGHGGLSTVDDVREFRDMIAEVADRVSALIGEGMTLEQVLAAQPTADLDERWGGAPERFLTGLYESLMRDGM